MPLLRDEALLQRGRDAELVSGDMGVGEHCQQCRQKDLLPTHCADCAGVFCAECTPAHARSCAGAGARSRVVQRCPDCKGMVAAGALMPAHQASGCTLHLVARRPKRPKCDAKGCSTKLRPYLAFDCLACSGRFCAVHRTAGDHACGGASPAPPRPGAAARPRPCGAQLMAARAAEARARAARGGPVPPPLSSQSVC